MFQILFRYPRVSSRHANGPLAQERSTFLSHLQTQGVPRSTLLRYASQLLLVAGLLPRKEGGQIARRTAFQKFGRFLRAYGWDEFPALWSVVLGHIKLRKLLQLWRLP